MQFLYAGIFCLLVGQDQEPPFQAEADKAVQARDYLRLEELSRKHTTQHPEDSLGWFYLGYARAAQGDHGGAVPHYQQAVQRGLKQFKAYYQLGYCAHRSGRHDIADAALSEALPLKPDDPDTLYYLGVSRFELAKYPSADEVLTRLLAVNSRWTELARLHRLMVRLKANRTDAQEDYEWLEKDGKSAEIQSRARELWLKGSERLSVQGNPQAPTWNVTFYEKVGYDSNVLRLPDTSQTLPTSESDMFAMTFLSSSLDILLPKVLTFRFSALDVSYADLDELALNAVLLAAESEIPLASSSFLVLGATGDAFFQDRERLFWRGGIRAGFRQEFAGKTQATASLLAGGKDFQIDTLDDLDSRELGTLVEVVCPKITESWSGRVQYEAHWEDADVQDRSYGEHRLELRTEIRFGFGLALRVEGGPRIREYEDVDRFYGEVRKDVRWTGRVGLLYERARTIQPFIEFEMERNLSSIADFDYRRRNIGLGAIIVF